MQALSHFVHHRTAPVGAFPVSWRRLQRWRGITDPVVMRDRRFGPSDLGAEASPAFFAHEVQ
jgi:hypothetical protein